MTTKLFIFDWDGTLADTAYKLVYCFQSAATELSLAVPTEAAIKQVVGLDLQHMIMALFPGLTSGQCSRIQESYWRYFTCDKTPSINFFPDARDVLERLKAKQCLLAVATGKSRSGLDRDLKEMDAEHLFAMTCTVDEAPSKPHPGMILTLMEALSMTPEQTVMVGDSGYDIQMAKSANVPCIAVTYGNQGASELAEYAPDKIITSLVSLLDEGV